MKSTRAIFTIVLWILSSPVFALDPRLSLAQFGHRSWNVAEGAPQLATNLAQTSDGLIWIGSSVGLFKFNGLQFERFAGVFGKQLPSNNVSALHADTKGNLWVGLRTGGVCLLSPTTLACFGEPEGLVRGSVLGIVETPDGVVWTLTAFGLSRYVDLRWHRVDESWNYRWTQFGFATALVVGQDGRLWVAAHGGAMVLRPGDQQFVEVGKPAGKYVFPQSIASGYDGSIWLWDLDNRLMRAAPNHPFDDTRQWPGPIEEGPLFVDRDGALWIGGEKLRRIARPIDGMELTQKKASEQIDQFGIVDGLSSSYAQAFLEDREGNVWVATNGGIDRFSRGSMVKVPLPSTMRGLVLIPTHDRNLLVGTRAYTSQLLDIRDGRPVNSLPLPPVQAGCRAADGSAWFANSQGLYQVNNGNTAFFPFTGERNSQEIQLLLCNGLNDFWISLAGGGLFRLHDGQWHENGGLDQLPHDVAFSILKASDGCLWIGYLRDGLWRISSDSVSQFGAAQGLSVGSVTALHEHAGRLWIGGDRGVQYLEQGKLSGLMRLNNLPFTAVSGIVDSRDGDLWLNGAEGIARIPRSEIDAIHDLHDPQVHAEQFDFLDGLPGVATPVRPLPSAIQAEDGTLWFALSDGLVWTDPTNLVRNTIPPLVSVGSLNTGGVAYPLSRDRLELPAGADDIRIAYSAASYKLPERVTFRYKLEGQDREWQNVGTRREAVYTNLTPGEYRFTVVACNESGIWSPDGASLKFTILPGWYQSIWFRLTVAAALSLLVVMAYQLRFARAVGRVTMLHQERLLERERIARDLHDTLLQGLQGLILRFQAAMLAMKADDPMRHSVESTLLKANRVLEEGRDKIYGLRSANESGGDLSTAIATLARELEYTDGPCFDLITQGKPQILQPLVFDEVYRIAAEALLNSYRHAHARRILTLIDYSLFELRLRFTDDGRGIPEDLLQAGSRPGHWGLPGMKERARRIRGRLTLHSSRDAGTEIELRIPAGVAYQQGAFAFLRRLLAIPEYRQNQ